MARIAKTAPLTEAELKAKITPETFFRRAEHFIRANLAGKELPTIRPGSEEWELWRQYFERHLGWVPLVMRKMLDRTPDASLAMTVPTQWPQVFDRDFIELAGWKPVPIRAVPPRHLHERLEELHQRFGPSWGIKQMPRAAGRSRAQVPTDDELRELYRRREPAPEVLEGVPF
jgi:hypothetical protein